MAAFNFSIQKWLSSGTALGVKLWILILTSVLVFLLVVVILTFIFHLCCRWRNHNRNRRSNDREAAITVEDFTEINAKKSLDYEFSRQGSVISTDRHSIFTDWEYSDWRRSSTFAFEEIALATDGFSEQNVVSFFEDYGVDYFGNLADDTKVIVKIFTANKSIGENEFIREAERIRHISHKNLVKMLGYYSSHGIAKNRMFVYRNIDMSNGNLHHWLHGCPQKPAYSPLTWSNRINIIQGIARGLAYLHEDVEPQILHGRLTSTCIFLDHNWNPKIFDFGLLNLFPPLYFQEPLVKKTYECVDNNGSSSPFSQKNDVFSFGILLMEIITGKPPLDCNQSQPCLIEWVKSLIGSDQAVETVDSKLEQKPSSKQLKRMLLIALRCVDPDLQLRPTMRQILLMLEPQDLLLADADRVREFL